MAEYMSTLFKYSPHQELNRFFPCLVIMVSSPNCDHNHFDLFLTHLTNLVILKSLLPYAVKIMALPAPVKFR